MSAVHSAFRMDQLSKRARIPFLWHLINLKIRVPSHVRCSLPLHDYRVVYSCLVNS